MPVFEPSTWAEVDEAVISNKPSAFPSDPFVLQVRSFTDAPERFLTSSSSSNTPSTTTSFDKLLNTASSSSSPHVLGRRITTTPLKQQRQFDDLLGLGRVDLDSESLVRRYTTPMNFKSPQRLSMFPSSSDIIINPSSTSFNSAAYLSKIHTDTSVHHLTEGKKLLTSVKERLDNHVNLYRSDKFVKAALVEAAFESTKTSLKPLSPFLKNEQVSTVSKFQRAEQILKKRYENVMQREQKLVRLQQTRSIYKKLQWLFTLDTRLRSIASMEQPYADVSVIEETVREYQRAVEWLRIQQRHSEEKDGATGNDDGESNLDDDETGMKNDKSQSSSSLSFIERSIESGFQVLFNSLLARLSSNETIHAKENNKNISNDNSNNNTIPMPSTTSVASKSSQETARLVTVLVSARREDLITQALERRTLFALQQLLQSTTMKSPSSSSTSTTAITINTTDSSIRISSSFTIGMEHIWRLARVLLTDSVHWLQTIDSQLTRLSHAYARALRELLLSRPESNNASEQPCVSAVTKAASSCTHVKQLVEPGNHTFSFINILDDVIASIVDVLINSTAERVKSTATQHAIEAVRSDNIGKQAAEKLIPSVIDALEVIDDDSLLQALKNRVDNMSDVRKDDEDNHSQSQSNSQSYSSLSGSGANSNAATNTNVIETLAIACLDTAVIFSQEIEKRMTTMRQQHHHQHNHHQSQIKALSEPDSTLSLRLAICCATLESSVLPKICDALTTKSIFQTSPYSKRTANNINIRLRTSFRRHMRTVTETIISMRDNSLERYLASICTSIKSVTRTLAVAFPEEKEDFEGHSNMMMIVQRSAAAPIRIDRVSKAACELTLRIALIVTRARDLNASYQLVSLILLRLIRDVGRTLVETINTRKLAYRRAAQLWVDVAFIQAVVVPTSLSLSGVKEAIDGFVRTSDRAVQAVVADGFGFSTVDMQTLRESVVDTAIREISIVVDTFIELWAYVKDGESFPEEGTEGECG